MKHTFITCFLISFLNITNANEARISRLEKKDIQDVHKSAIAQNKLLRKIIQNQKEATRLEIKLNKQLKTQARKPYIWEKKEKILTGKVYKGLLLNSIVSTNLASPVLVRVGKGQGLPAGTKFACRGVSKNKRIHTQCERMILDKKEVQISAQLLNTDGTAGLVGEIEDGKEDMVLGSLASNFSQGMLSAAQERTGTPYGTQIDSSLKNRIMQGLIQTGGKASDLFLDEMKNITPVVTVQAGTEVLIYFQEEVREY